MRTVNYFLNQYNYVLVVNHSRDIIDLYKALEVYSQAIFDGLSREDAQYSMIDLFPEHWEDIEIIASQDYLEPTGYSSIAFFCGQEIPTSMEDM